MGIKHLGYEPYAMSGEEANPPKTMDKSNLPPPQSEDMMKTDKKNMAPKDNKKP